MKLRNRRATAYMILFAAAVIATTLAIRPLFVSAGPELPPRSFPTPSPADDDDDDTLIGAHILLQSRVNPAGAWATVQWQDSSGGWHNVEGWHGALNGQGLQIWWVATKDFGTGPFRWTVTQGQNGPVMGVSAPFNLPRVANETVQVLVASGF